MPLVSCLCLLCCLLQTTHAASLLLDSEEASVLKSEPTIKSLEYNGSLYLTDRTPATFMEAFTWCTSMGGHLPSVHSRADIDMLIEQLRLGSTWLGAVEIRDTFYWTDGSPWHPLPDSWSKSPCYTCCGLVVSISKKLVAKSRCDAGLRFQRVCRVPPVIGREVHLLKEQLAEANDKLSQRISVDQILYQELVNATLAHSQQIVDLEKVVEDLLLASEVTQQRISMIQEEHNATTSMQEESALETMAKLNASLHERMDHLRHEIHETESRSNRTTGNRIDFVAVLMQELRSASRQEQQVTSDRITSLKEAFNQDILWLQVALVSVVAFALAVPLAILIRRRRLRAAYANRPEDEVRLSSINDAY